MSSRWLALALAIASWSPGVSAQDVEMLGRRHGTRPPAGYYRELERDPEAYRFTRGRAARLRETMARQSVDALRAPGAAGVGGPALTLGPRSGPVVGDVYIPVILGLFQDSPASSLSQATIQGTYFGTTPGTATVSTYYAEVSSDSIALDGDVRDWVRSALSEAQATQGESGLVCCGIGDYIRDLIAMQSGVDWGAYDNDGPDGTPNSGDDDGFVDALAVMHPNHGAECGGSGGDDRIWSHKWSLSDASSMRAPYTTSTPSASGGFIRVDDYFVQGARACTGSGLNEIGVFVHETGHAFGLPDLYDTRQFGSTHAGAGAWELMAFGTWGCTGNTPSRPCHMGAWSKAMLGWVDVTALAPDTDFGTLTLPPVETTGVVYRVDAADGSGEYFLLENRQDLPARTFDKNLFAEGLLVWQIDWDVVVSRWASNTVNAASHMGVWLRQADGSDDLGRSGGGRGDGGDPFPGSTGATDFHAGSSPASRSFQGSATGLTVRSVNPTGDDVAFELRTTLTTVTLDASGTAGGSGGLFRVNGATVPDPPANFVRLAPFDTRTLEAAAGELVAAGERRPFDQWVDAPTAPRTRTVTVLLADTTFTAAYAGTQYELAIGLSGGVNGVMPGSLATAPPPTDPTGGFWFAPGLDVHITALPRTGFAFSAWTGALTGQPNPASVTMSSPVQAGASFILTYGVAATDIDFTATVQQSVQLAVQNGTAPVTWQLVSGALPEGLALAATGLLAGASLDFGAFPVMVRATDALGLTADATITLDVAAPVIPIAELASAFLLGGPALDLVEATFLDHHGNADGTYDLGDFRAWVLANPSLPLSAAVAPLGEGEATRTITLPARLEEPR